MSTHIIYCRLSIWHRLRDGTVVHYPFENYVMFIEEREYHLRLQLLEETIAQEIGRLEAALTQADGVALHLKTLCARAALALEDWLSGIPEEWQEKGPDSDYALIRELREAAQ